MHPVSDRIFVKLQQNQNIHQTPLILLDDKLNKSKANIGTVEAVGDLVKSVKVGDQIMFHPFDELETPLPDLVVIREKSLLGLVSN